MTDILSRRGFDHDAALRMWANGSTASAIKSELAVSTIHAVVDMIRRARKRGDARAILHRPGKPATWDAARIARLTALWEDGKSASEIAAEFGDGTTRNAVLGKVHRLKFPRRSRQQAVTNQRRAAHTRRPNRLAHIFSTGAPKALAFSKPPVTTVSVPIIRPDCAPVAILDIGHGQCRAIVSGDGIATMFCAGPTVAEGSWCLFHRALVFQPAMTRSRIVRTAATAAYVPQEVPFDG